MASHGPSFRFATPRPKEQQTPTASLSSRLPLRNIQETDAQPPAAARQPFAASNKPAERSPAKLRRKNIPDSAKSHITTKDTDLSTHVNATAGHAASDLHRLVAVPPVTIKPSRRFFSPKSPEVVTCVVTPTSSLVSGPPTSTRDSPKSNILRRRPSVIGRYVSSRRDDSPLENDRGGLPLGPRLDQVHTSTSPANDDGRLRSPFESSTSYISPVNHDVHTWYPMATPISEQSTTPSLRHTDSPSVFSHAASATPTSQTSYSPYIAQSPHFGPAAWNSPVKSVQDLRLGLHEAPYSMSSAHQNEKSNESLSFGNQHTATLVPELAHLMIDAVLPKSTERQPPVRPSREGTPSLGSPQTSPVIISNLPRLAGHHRRQSSSSGPESASRSEDGSEKKGVSSPVRPTSQQRARPSTSDSKSPPVSHYVVPEHTALTARPSPKLTESPKPSSRFGFLHRKDKAEQIQSQEEAARQLKKGPMAGTGHEGYGKYAAKGRTSSSVSVNSTNGRPISLGNSSQTSSNRKSNGSSAKSDAAADDFLSQRLAPVYLRGSGLSSEGPLAPCQILRSDSSSSLADDAPASGSSVNSPNPSSGSRSSLEPSRPPKKLSNTPLSAATSVSSRAPSSRGRGSWGSVNRGPDRRVSKEASESLRIQRVPGKSEMPQQPSTAIAGGKTGPREDSKTRKSNWSFFSKSSPGSKQAQKWNPFQRSHSSPPREERVQQPETIAMEAPDSPRALAHYAMPEDKHHLDFKELEDLMEEADAHQTDNQSDLEDFPTEIGRSRPYSHEKSLVYTETALILASHLELSPELRGEHAGNAARDVNAAETGPGENTQQIDCSLGPRPSRLAQVGRIPKVVSRRDRQRKLPDQSFSRPFAVSHPRPSLGSPELSLLLPVATAAALGTTVPSIQDQVSQLRTNQSVSTLSKPSTQDLEQGANIRGQTSRGSTAEFFTLRKNSDLSFSSSSGTPYFPSTASTAIIPSAVSPVSEDEIWREYDDLIDHVLTPVVSNGSGVLVEAPGPKDYFSGQPLNHPQPEEPMAGSKTAFPKLGDLASSLRPDLSPFVGTQRRSEIFSGFEHPAVSPLDESPGAGDREYASYPYYMAEDIKSSMMPPLSVENRNHQYQISSVSVSKENAKSGQEENSTPADTGNLDNADSLKLTPKSMANLRFGALMTSKWLSFGRVLFSPGHSQLGATVSDRILVIDGLGKDWSYYLALTYPNASIYSLGPEPARASNRQSLSQWQTLTNHRHFSHADMSSNFPFPKNFFAVVVFRFPIATSEAELRSALCECKRVLQPGGYLEVSALDLDLTNMGTKARRAVRELKTKMQAAVPDVCLKLASDNIQYLLGRRGFENLKSCVVGVPAAGAIADSRSNSRDEGEMSFTQLVADTSKTGDAAMTKMVAKVGRWWYMKTYETLVLPGGDVSQSIWNDTGLLRECETNQTTFKLLVCYAQKPSMAKRRTVSL